jgi:hypothetical protein
VKESAQLTRHTDCNENHSHLVTPCLQLALISNKLLWA